MAEAVDAVVSGAPPHPGYRERYPWHEPAWAALMRDTARLPHAILLHGPAGVGKRAFAWRFAQAVLCGSPRLSGGCGECASCARFAAGTHPDLRHVTPLEDSRAIAIDQVRELRDFVALTPHTSVRKLALLEPADAMNLNAANALLKVLEEPPAASMLVLVSAQPARLPATIRSRCAAVALRPPPAASAAAWLRERQVAEPEAVLELAGGGPLAALELASSGALEAHERFLADVEALRAGSEDPLACAARWKGYGAARCLAWLHAWLARRIRAEMGSATDGEKQRRVRDLFRYMDVVSEARALLPGPLDEALLLEDISIAGAQLLPKDGLNSRRHV